MQFHFENPKRQNFNEIIIINATFPSTLQSNLMKVTYEETLDFLFSQLPMYQRMGTSALKKDLTNIRRLTEHLDKPHNAYPCIHIAGTNGKGTIAHLIASILQESGLRVGLYTSPHYVDFRERIKINGNYIPKEFVTSFVDRIREELQEVTPSFFEFSVAMAFEYFKQEKIDIAVIETGLGGRLDSTNIITPILSVITNISLDHQSMLGNTEYQIATEKAGIIKPSVPLIVGKYQVSCDHIFINKAKQLSSEISFASLNWTAEQQLDKILISSLHSIQTYEIERRDGSPFFTENVITAIESIEKINSVYDISTEQIINGINKFRAISNYIGRWQILNSDPLTVADSAHNYEAIQSVLRSIKAQNYNHIHFILGFVKDKDVDELLSLFPCDQTYYFTKPDVVRGLKVDRLFEIGKKAGIAGKLFPNVKEAIYAATRMAEPGDLIYIGGSSFVVSDAIRVFQN